MWEPIGPLPAAVYWRRRWVAIASAAMVTVLLIWGITALVSTSDEPETSRPASRAAVSAPQEASPPPAAPRLAAPPFASLSATGLPSTTAPPAERRSAAAQPGAAGPTTHSTPGPGAPTSTGEPLVPGQIPTPSPTPAPTSAPVEPVRCTNEMLEVRSEVDGSEHRVGERMLLRLVVTNISDGPCVRDLGPVSQEIVVWSADGSTRLWSSDDCSSAEGADPRTLVPGEPVASAVRWAGRTSEPGCPARRETVPAGEYRLLTRVDDLISPPTQFVRVP